MNWLHRRIKTGMKHYLRAEYGNFVLRLIRNRIADHIIYQSQFAKDWWQSVYGESPCTNSVIYNAVDLDQFNPNAVNHKGKFHKPKDHFRLLLVEGSLEGGYELGLESAIDLANWLGNSFGHILEKPVELVIAGRVSEEVRTACSNIAKIPLVWVGLVPTEQIPKLDTSAHLLYSSDLHPACPNSVIESLACGTPVLAFDTGALPELITGNSGCVVPYGSDPWRLEKPNIKALAEAAVDILRHQNVYRTGARERAEEMFGLDKMINGYLRALSVSIAKK
jgi:glycosyltransferase involved in cell wall biosynthesis